VGPDCWATDPVDGGTQNGRMQIRRLTRLVLATLLATLTVGQAAVVQASTPSLVLPDLVMVPPFDIRIEYTGDGRKLLRFSTISANIGAGPFQVVGYDPVDGRAAGWDILSVRQQIKRSDGSWVDRATTAKMMWAGDGHNHWHIVNYQAFRLQTVHSKTLLVAAKTGFCAFDSYLYGSSKPAFYTWEKTCRIRDDGTVLEGTSRRWGDIYKSNIAFQWIDITLLPLGDYKLKVIADPPYSTGGQFRESNETNNRAWTKIRIGRTTVTVLAKSPQP
jgi:hypothetical protein